MCRDTVGGRIDQLANYCCYKKVTENTVANSCFLPVPPVLRRSGARNTHSTGACCRKRPGPERACPPGFCMRHPQGGAGTCAEPASFARRAPSPCAKPAPWSERCPFPCRPFTSVGRSRYVQNRPQDGRLHRYPPGWGSWMYLLPPGVLGRWAPPAPAMSPHHALWLSWALAQRRTFWRPLSSVQWARLVEGPHMVGQATVAFQLPSPYRFCQVEKVQCCPYVLLFHDSPAHGVWLLLTHRWCLRWCFFFVSGSNRFLFSLDSHSCLGLSVSLFPRTSPSLLSSPSRS